MRSFRSTMEELHLTSSAIRRLTAIKMCSERLLATWWAGTETNFRAASDGGMEQMVRCAAAS